MQLHPFRSAQPAVPLPPALESPRGGEVWLVGAGPGDPELLTLKGWRLLEAADVVVHDRLGCEEFVALLPPRVRRIDVGKGHEGRAPRQQEINAILAAEAHAGQLVVRLKGGDPFVFGRGMEEVLHLRAEGIACRVVPGISSAVAVPQAAGIPVTHRGVARHFQVSTARTETGVAEASGTGADTRVFLMGVEALPKITAQLLAAGLPPETPTAVVAHGTTYRQGEARGTIATIADAVREAGLEAPAVLIVGHTVALSEAAPARETILVTSTRIPDLLRRHAGDARLLWRPLSRLEAIDAAALRALRPTVERAIAAGSWIVLNSRPAATHFAEVLLALGLDARRVQARLAAIGAETVAALQERCLAPDLAAIDGEQEGLGAELAEPLRGHPVFLACADPYHGDLALTLRHHGAASIELLPVYRQLPTEPGSVDWRFVRTVFFASPAAAGRFATAWPEAPLGRLHALCIGESTRRRAHQAGFGAATDLATGAAESPGAATATA